MPPRDSLAFEPSVRAGEFASVFPILRLASEPKLRASSIPKLPPLLVFLEFELEASNSSSISTSSIGVVFPLSS